MEEVIWNNRTPKTLNQTLTLALTLDRFLTLTLFITLITCCYMSAMPLALMPLNFTVTWKFMPNKPVLCNLAPVTDKEINDGNLWTLCITGKDT